MSTGIADMIGKIRRMVNKGAGETFNPATDSLEALAEALATIMVSIPGAFLTLTETGGTLTSDGTEQNLYINNAPAGIFEPRAIQLDCTNMAAGDDVTLRVYYRIKSGGGFVLHTVTPLADDVSPDLVTISLLPNRYGVQVTLEETAGAHNAFDYEVLYEV